ncbi:hypothetical protein LIA77_06706 [Sarocladium implicatum]|nr:hypothetical protein LIA77_06706 [Sarocladium implicatum]
MARERRRKRKVFWDDLKRLYAPDQGHSLSLFRDGCSVTFGQSLRRALLVVVAVETGSEVTLHDATVRINETYGLGENQSPHLSHFRYPRMHPICRQRLGWTSIFVVLGQQHPAACKARLKKQTNDHPYPVKYAFIYAQGDQESQTLRSFEPVANCTTSSQQAKEGPPLRSPACAGFMT